MNGVRLADPGSCTRMERPTLLLIGGLCALKLAAHLALVNRYGYHGDELYFIECGRHLAFGYVDHAPLIPWIARVAEELGGASLFALRLPAILASAGTMPLIALLVREWGGGRRAQLLALLSFLLAPAHLRLGAMLNIPVIEVFLCTAAAYFVARALRREEAWAWIAAGAISALALLAKHTTLLWGAALALGLLVSEQRRALAKPAPWVALAIALALFVPNLIWQMQHGYPTLEFSADLRSRILTEQGRLLFVLGQVLYFHPLAAPVWIAGIAFAFTDGGRAARPFAALFLAMLAALLILGGKPYYLASAYPAMLAAGGIALERWWAHRTLARRALVASIAAVGIALALVTLPLLPIRTVDRAIGQVFGWIVPPIALTHDMHGMLGWDAHVDTVEHVLAELSAEDRARAALLTRSYAQAGALNVLRDDPTPHAVSGHMTYHLWGPEPGRGAVLIAYGVPRSLLAQHYGVVEERARIVAPDARRQDTDLAVYVCREPAGQLRDLWPQLRSYGPGAARER